MPTLDVFKESAFSMASLTAAINKAPYKPKLLGSLNLFSMKPQTTLVAMVEDRRGTLALLPVAARGTTGAVRSQPQRTVRPFDIPHVPYFQTVRADDVQSIRAFGSESELESVASVVNDQLQGMRADHETTHEWHRIGAVKGTILDADASTTIFNLFTEFGVTQSTATFNFSNTNLKDDCYTVIRGTADKLGNDSYTKLIALCGDNFFTSMSIHSDTKNAFDRFQNGAFLRESQLGPEYSADAMGFDFGGITWVNYRGAIGGTSFVATGEAYVVPVGVPDLFVAAVAPADFTETVNTRGQLLYAKQERLKFDKGVELHTQSNVLWLCTRPSAVYKLTGSNFLS